LYGINVETLTADKTLTVNEDRIYQYLDPSTANRIVTLSTTGARAGDRFIIRHNGAYDSGYYLDVQQGGVSLDRVYAGVVKEFIFDGTNWVSRGIGTGEDDNKRYQVGIGERARPSAYGVAVGYDAVATTYGVAVGYDAKGYIFGVGVGASALGYSYGVAVGYSTSGHTYGVAVGYYSLGYSYGVAVGCASLGYSYGVAVGFDADGYSEGVAVGYKARGYSCGVAVGLYAYGYSYGVAVGYYALGYSRGVAVGHDARGYSYGVAVGYSANSGAKRYSIAIGYYSRCTRTSETAVNIDGNASYLRQATQGRWYGRTTDATPTEIFCGGISGERFTIRAKSAVAFKGLIVASTEAVTGTPNVTKAWLVEGLIKRDADGVTSIVGTVSVSVIAQDADAKFWDITVDADDTNEALRITVIGQVGKIIDWCARFDCVECVW